MELFLSTLAIFLLRLIDVSIASVRIITLMRGRIGLASVMGFFESAFWVTAAAIVFANLDNPIRLVGFAAGFAVGTFLGGNIERWLAMGTSLVRVVTSVEGDQPPRVAAALRGAGFPVTVLNASGRDGEVRLTMAVMPRKKVRQALSIVASVNPQAFTTVEDTHIPEIQRLKASGVRK